MKNIKPKTQFNNIANGNYILKKIKTSQSLIVNIRIYQQNNILKWLKLIYL